MLARVAFVYVEIFYLARHTRTAVLFRLNQRGHSVSSHRKLLWPR